MNLNQIRYKQDINLSMRKGPKYKMYERAIDRLKNRHSSREVLENRDDLKKLIFLELKYIEAICRSGKNDRNIAFNKKTPIKKFSFLDSVANSIGLLKPLELVEMFLVSKIYDGDKSQMKDYYSTMEVINGLNQDQPIGKKVFSLLWDYMNWTLRFFMVEIVSAVNQAEIYQEFPDAFDVIFGGEDKESQQPKAKFSVIMGGLS